MMSSTSPRENQKAVGVRSAVACTTCRRAKVCQAFYSLPGFCPILLRGEDGLLIISQVRCDGEQRFPAPCSRCALRNSLCQLDRSVKTPRKRHVPGPEHVPQSNLPQAGDYREGGPSYDGKLADLSRQLSEIRDALNLPGQTPEGHGSQSSGREDSRNTLHNRSMEDHRSELNGDLSHLSARGACHELGGVSLKAVEVDQLYSQYVQPRINPKVAFNIQKVSTNATIRIAPS